jgi:hypothetical protein
MFRKADDSDSSAYHFLAFAQSSSLWLRFAGRVKQRVDVGKILEMYLRLAVGTSCWPTTSSFIEHPTSDEKREKVMVMTLYGRRDLHPNTATQPTCQVMKWLLIGRRQRAWMERSGRDFLRQFSCTATPPKSRRFSSRHSSSTSRQATLAINTASSSPSRCSARIFPVLLEFFRLIALRRVLERIYPFSLVD